MTVYYLHSVAYCVRIAPQEFLGGKISSVVVVVHLSDLGAAQFGRASLAGSDRHLMGPRSSSNREPHTSLTAVREKFKGFISEVSHKISS